jgi:hypothetical protein
MVPMVSPEMQEALSKTDKQFKYDDTSKKATPEGTLKLKNNGKHGSGTDPKSSKYTITIKVNGDDIDVTGAWGSET